MAVKHAIKSTEFYLAALAVTLLGVNLFWRIPEEISIDPKAAAGYANVNNACTVIGIMVVVAIYVIGRSLVKKNEK